MSRSLQAVNKDWASPWGVHLSCCQELILQALVVCHVGTKEIVGRLQISFPRIVHWRLSWYHMIFLLFATCFQDEPHLLPIEVWVKPFPWMITKWIIYFLQKIKHTLLPATWKAPLCRPSFTWVRSSLSKVLGSWMYGWILAFKTLWLGCLPPLWFSCGVRFSKLKQHKIIIIGQICFFVGRGKDGLGIISPNVIDIQETPKNQSLCWDWCYFQKPMLVWKAYYLWMPKTTHFCGAPYPFVGPIAINFKNKP